MINDDCVPVPMSIDRHRLARAMYETDMIEAHPLGDWLAWGQRCMLDPVDCVVTRYRDRAAAVIAHAQLGVFEPAPEIPKRPWNVLWVNGRTYLIDADDRKLATLLGAQPQREAVAEALIAAFGAGAP